MAGGVAAVFVGQSLLESSSCDVKKMVLILKTFVTRTMTMKVNQPTLCW